MRDSEAGRTRGDVPSQAPGAGAGQEGEDRVCLDVSRGEDLLLYCGPALGPSAGPLAEPADCERAAHVLLEHLRQHAQGDAGVALTLPLAAAAVQADLSWFEGRVRVVFWRVREAPDKAGLKLLWQSAKQGVWNVVLSDAQSPAAVRTAWDAEAAAEPTVLHARFHQRADGRLQGGELSERYGETADLEGRPLWTRLADPAELLCAVLQHGVKVLCRMRVDDGATFTVGAGLEYHFATPDEMPAAVFDEVLRLVAAGGAVTTERVRANLKHAFLIGYVIERGRVVADSSLKHPREEYIEAVHRQTGFDLRGFLERGYTSVRPEYRGLGIGTRLLAGLTERAEGRKFYSIIAEDNEATKTMARRNNTVQVGSFFSTKMDKQVGVWTAAEFADSVGG